MNLKRFTAALLTALIIAGTLASCSDKAAAPSSSETAATSAAETEAETEEPKIDWKSANLPTIDYEGRAYNILYNGSVTEGQNWRYVDVEDLSGEVLNDAIYERNSKIEELYNAKIACVYSSNFANDLKNTVTAADGAYDTVFGPANTLLSSAQSAYLLNWYDLPYINLEAQWWDKSVIDGLTLYGRLYLCTGDISPLTNVRVYSLVFNKDLCRELGLELPYQHVLDGTWTIDTFSNYITDVNYDVNGDGQMNYDDRWGYFSQKGNTYMMYYSGGGRVTEKDGDGNPELVFNDDKYINLAIKALEVSFDKNKTLMADEYVSKNGGSWAAASAWFANGGSLLRSSVFEPVPRDYRAMDTDFGILPYPKLDERQEKHYTLPEHTSMMFAVPSTADAEFSSIILESLAAESVSGVTYAFYEVSLKGKSARDDESEAMLDIIFGNKVFDIGYVLDLATLNSALTALENNASTDVASKYTSISKSAQKNLDKLIEKYQALN